VRATLGLTEDRLRETTRNCSCLASFPAYDEELRAR
jgi:hypothetical protein